MFSRRRFIRDACSATFGLTTASSSLFKLNTLRAAAKNNLAYVGDDYKALVCLFQAGGNDSHNMLVPTDTGAYSEYAMTRTNLALRKDELINLIHTNNDNRTYGLNASMEGVGSLFNEGKLAFVNNVGTMIQPVNKAEYEDRKVPLPLGLFSHSDQIAQWQTAQPGQRVSTGWGGKLAEMFQDMNTSNDISMNITLSGTNVFQFADKVVEYSVSPSGEGYGIRGYQGERQFDVARTKLIDGLLYHDYEDIYQKTYVDVLRNSIDAQQLFNETIENLPEFNTEFSGDRLSQSFKMIAKIISAREILGFKRQIFFVRVGGWDHHDDLLRRQNGMLAGVSSALSEFASALQEVNAFDQVVTFSMSEFGRTLTSNGDGSDHAWGGNVMVMGGSVKGARMYGDYPSLALGNPLEIGRGRIIPTISNDEYFAELALWFGVAASDLPTILPNVGNFYNGNGSPLGFLEMT